LKLKTHQLQRIIMHAFKEHDLDLLLSSSACFIVGLFVNSSINHNFNLL
jgi:hypothetical protein